MNRKIYWGLGVLILLFAGFMVYVQYDRAKFQDDMDEHKKWLESMKDRDAEPENVAIDDSSPSIEHQPVQITEVPNQNPQQKSESVRKTFSVEGEVEFSQLPELPADIDPDDIPPFYMKSYNGDGTIFYYNRPLTARESEVYYEIKQSFKTLGPASLKMLAVTEVRKERDAAGEFNQIMRDLVTGVITSDDADRLIDEYCDMTTSR